MEAGQTTITMREAQPSKPSKSKARPSSNRLVKKMIRPFTYFIVGLLVLSVGLGAWSYFGSRRHSDDADSISDLDGLDFPATAFDSSKVSKQDSMMPIRTPSSTVMASERSQSNGTNDQTKVKGQDRFAAVWLTGTIEEVDRNDPGDSIRRISGGRSESTNLR